MIILLVFTAFLAFLFHELYWKRRNLPPGPIPLPFMGNILTMLLNKPGYECFRNCTKKYGDVYTFWMGKTPFVMISSYDLLKDTFVRDGDTYKDKYPQPLNQKIRGGNYGIVESNGHLWSTHRRFALTTLRDFGLGKDLMQEKILIEVEDIFKKFDAQLGLEQDVSVVMNNAIANVINQNIFGYRFEGDKEEDFKKLRELMEYQETAFATFKVYVEAFIPKVGALLPGRSLNELLEEWRDNFYTFFDTQIENHRKKIDFDSQESLDYAEAYLKEQRKQEALGEFELFSNKQLSNTCLDLWLAGLSTTNTTVNWTICYVLNHPDVLQKMNEEFDQVVGSDRLVTMGDKNNLPYFNAVLNESQRCANIVPINLFHATTKDTVINGYPVKKGTGVIAQISTVMLDEKIFPDPYKFNPDRFIDENGKPIKIEQLIPFSIGKRQCPGEGLARMEMFLFLANFFNRYKISPSSKGFPNLDKKDNVGVFPKDLHAILNKRN
ncbi:CYtochrome P450 family [Caenorhabditis elegans]|uniref:CYtochrome P450 family n=1 Tax=Caenorhabditis elegans TaxID=6239 RepID=O16362_CAEEL|nr:CYtochrome P450 family [Caenorhabditis elegans]CCD71001.1 CYtochrome P450 family [Caenorhabditis elegans]|eukprot:NP_503612.1 CYtochrome P450 family [Caenorhabditis elegans]